MNRALPLLAVGLGIAAASGAIIAARHEPEAVARVQGPAAPSALPAQHQGVGAPAISTCANDGEARRCRSSVNAASG